MSRVFVTKHQYDQIEECNCGGPVLKYHNTSRNEFIAKCGYFKKIIEIDKETKRKIWIAPKRVACDWRVMYAGERPVFKVINNILKKTPEIQKSLNVNERLEEQLRVLFLFLHVSNHSSTLDEINILVKNNLIREPKTPLETFREFEERIFSKKIIDLSHTIELPQPEKSVVFIDLPFLHRENLPPRPPRIIPKNYYKPATVSQFIEIEQSDHEEESDQEETDTEQSRNSDDDDNDEQSDFESVFDEPVEEDEDPFDDIDAPDYYDD